MGAILRHEECPVLDFRVRELDMLDNMNKQDIACAFSEDESILDGCKVLFAVYKQEDYEGSALVIFTKDDKLFEVSGSHCSCNGLEGQWAPEETSLEAIRMRDFSYYGFNGDVENLLVDLVFERDVLTS
jgi:hypothetical protein